MIIARGLGLSAHQLSMILTLLHCCSNQLFLPSSSFELLLRNYPVGFPFKWCYQVFCRMHQENPNTSTIPSRMIFITSLLYPYPTETMGSYFKELTEMNSVKLFQFRLCYVIYINKFLKSLHFNEKFSKNLYNLCKLDFQSKLCIL